MTAPTRPLFHAAADSSAAPTRAATGAFVMRTFDLDVAAAIAGWLHLWLRVHAAELASADGETGSPAPAGALDCTLRRALALLRVEPTRELFTYLRWSVQRRLADEAAEARGLRAAPVIDRSTVNDPSTARRSGASRHTLTPGRAR